MKMRDLGASSLGNILEWFDFGLYIYLAPLLGRHFFPAASAQTTTFEALAVFAAGFVCRPLGGIFFGFLGDRYGRVLSLRLSILMITLTMMLVGCLPSFQTWGLTATILFTLLRVCQGLSVGGEYTAIMIYLAESAPHHRRGFFTSFAAVAANLGFLLASLSVWLLNQNITPMQLESWAWRIPFLFAGIIGLLLFINRLRLMETPVFQALLTQKSIPIWPLLRALMRAPRQLLQILGLSCMGGVFYYVFFGYMPTYLSENAGITLSKALMVQSIFLVIMLFLVPLAGALGDRFGRRKLLIITAMGIIVTAIPSFYLLHSQSYCLLILVFAVATIFSSIEQGNTLIAVVETCPADVRASGVSFTYNVGMAIFGGTAPLMVASLVSHVNIYAPAYYVMGAAALTLLVVFGLPETYRRDMLKTTE